MKKYILHLDNPAGSWDNASPIGNGAAGLMIYGFVAEERLTLNEESVWSGEQISPRADGFAEKIAHVRKIFLEDKDIEANEWIENNLSDAYIRIKSYEYAGELRVSLHGDGDCEDYNRDIDLVNGVATVSYKKDGVSYSRKYFASYPTGLLCARYSADSQFTAKIAYTRELTDCVTVSTEKISAKAHTAFGDKRFLVSVKIKTDGESSVECGSIKVENASYIEVYTFIATEFKYENTDEAAEKALTSASRSWDELLAEHIKDHSSLMSRSDISFGGNGEFDSLSVSARLERLKNDPTAEDSDLISLYWQFGKYLLIGSSRPGTLPANLQGVWADGLKSPWNSDYHTNINLQMNYWQAETANISECTQALFDYMIGYLLPGGKISARENYGTGGMVVHHLSDIYGFARAADGPWGLWPWGGAWLAYHLWEHYLYTGDKDFLRDTAYQYIRECAQFAIENMFEGKDGYLHTGPSTSPENKFIALKDGKPEEAFITISPTMDLEIVGGLLDFYVECENILGIDPEYAKIAKEKRGKMLPLRVGKYGQLMEWRYDFEEAQPGHRHISHAFALYPAAQITRATPELYRAIEVTLDRRLANGGGHTGWSRAWLINLFARLRNGEKTYENIRTLLSNSTKPNLLDDHPPFEIDGNFGGSAGISEMLLQSHEGLISLLPALPSCLSCGSFSGLRARGGVTVSAQWEKGRITSLELLADKPTKVKLELPGEEIFEVSIDKKTVVR